MRTPIIPLFFALLLGSSTGCEKSSGSGPTANPNDPEAEPHYGYENSSSDDFAAIPRALSSNDIEGLDARGVTIWRLQRAMRLGDRAFAGFVGVTAAKFQALASIDAGNSSGEIAFYRWDQADLEDGDAQPTEAKRWVVVSITLDPDEILEARELNSEPTGEQVRTLAGLAVALAKAEADHPGSRWVAYTFRELEIRDGSPTGARQTRVYLVGADTKSPDLEYTVVDPAKKKHPPAVTNEVLHLAGTATSKLPLTTPAQAPGPTTIARAIAIATVTETPVEIIDGAGNTWSIAPKTGTMTRK